MRALPPLRTLLLPPLIALLAVAIGGAVAFKPEVGLVLAVAAVAVCAGTAPASSWVLAAAVSAVALRGLVTLGALPSVATYLDLPLAWGALCVALIRRRSSAPRTGFSARWVIALAVAVLAAWIAHPTEPLRPVVYLILLGEPFAIVAALVLDPPSAPMRRALVRTLTALLLLQIPIAIVQVVAFGIGDGVQGTLYGAGAGHHTISAVAAIGAVWFLARGELPLPRRLLVAAGLFAVPLLADGKQVLVALPALLVAARWPSVRLRLVVALAAVALPLVALFQLRGTDEQALYYLEQFGSGENGKVEVAEDVWAAISAEPTSLMFGLGPAQSVSRAAFLSTESFQQPNSPLMLLDLEPATFSVEANIAAAAFAGGESSVNSGLSSALGVLGDLGLVGMGIYGGALLALILALRRKRSPEALAAAGGFAVFAVLGFVFDWWEQPPFSVFLATLAGLALTKRPDE